MATTWRENTWCVASEERDSWQSTSATANDCSWVSLLTSNMLTHSCVSTNAALLVGDDVLSPTIMLSVITTASTLARDVLNNFLFDNHTSRPSHDRNTAEETLTDLLFCWCLWAERTRNKNYKNTFCHAFFSSHCTCQSYNNKYKNRQWRICQITDAIGLIWSKIAFKPQHRSL